MNGASKKLWLWINSSPYPKDLENRILALLDMVTILLLLKVDMSMYHLIRAQLFVK